MKKTLVILNFIFSLIIISCNSKQEKKIFYESGSLKLLSSFDENNELQFEIKYYDLPNNQKYKILYRKNNYDSLAYFYDNGKLFKNGKQDLKGNVIGKWNYYNKDGFLSDTKEYFLVNNSLCKNCPTLNQEWYYNEKGDTMFYGNNKFNVYNQKEFESESKGEKTSRFIRFHFYPQGDTISIAEPFTSIAEDAFPAFGAKNSEEYVVLAQEKFNFNNDFSNEAEVKLDTFYCLKKDKKNRSKFPNADKRHTVVFGRWFDTPGKKILRGYLMEYYTRKPTPDNDNVKYETQIYFEKIIYVKDTIRKKKNDL